MEREVIHVHRIHRIVKTIRFNRVFTVYASTHFSTSLSASTSDYSVCMDLSTSPDSLSSAGSSSSSLIQSSFSKSSSSSSISEALEGTICKTNPTILIH